ncbi:MAG: hypothetical protein IJV00_05290 [Clostridia bacterium]|nr:hypothetical protein [Clostridia bacterium]
MKKFIFAALVIALIASFCACAAQNVQTAKTGAVTKETVSTAATTAQTTDAAETKEEDGNRLLYKKTQWSPNGSVITTYEYDGSGNVTLELSRSGSAQTRRENTYDNNGNLISCHVKQGGSEYTNIAEYNENGKVIKSYYLETPDEYILSEYNEDGTNAKRTAYKDGAILYELFYTYNEDGTITIVSQSGNSVTEEALYSKTEKPIRISSSSGMSREYEYDQFDNETKISYTFQDGSVTTVEYTYEYDGEGRIVKQTNKISTDGELYTTVFEYGDNGELAHTITTNSLGVKTEEVDYEYKLFPKD